MSSREGQTSGIPAHRPIWRKTRVALQQLHLERRADRTAIFVGDKSAGKTTLIQVFLNQFGKKDIKPSAPLEYSFGRKASATGAAKELAHIYEVGGGKAFHELTAIPVDAEKLSNTLVVIVLDLSRLSSILPTFEYWLEAVEQQLESRAKALVSVPGTLKEAQDKLWLAHDDRKYIHPTSVPVLVVAHKYDIFIKEDPYFHYCIIPSEKRKWLCRALRFVAHSRGCSLVVTSIQEKASLPGYKALMSHFLFGAENAAQCEKDHMKALCLGPGEDALSAIGEPKVGISLTK